MKPDDSTQEEVEEGTPDLPDLYTEVNAPNMVESIPGVDGSEQAVFLMPSKKEFPLFGLKEMKGRSAARLWQVYTSTRRRWFPFELYRIGELVYYEVKMQKIRKKMEKQGGDVWYIGEHDEPRESPYYPLLDKFTSRRDKLIRELGLNRSLMVRENKIVGKKRATHGNESEGQHSPTGEEGLIPK